MVVAWDKFYTQVQPYVPGCPEIVMDEHLRRAAVDFCARSEVWRFDIEPRQTFPGVSDYYLDTPNHGRLEDVTHLFLEGRRLDRIADLYEQPNPQVPDTRPDAYAVYMGGALRFFPTPDREYAFQGAGVLRPAQTATGVEDFIFETYGSDIICGAVASLLEIPNKEWSNPEASLYYRSRFHRAADDAKGRQMRRTGTQVRLPGFA